MLPKKFAVLSRKDHPFEHTQSHEKAKAKRGKKMAKETWKLPPKKVKK